MNKKLIMAVVGLVVLGGGAFVVVGSAGVPEDPNAPKPGEDRYYTGDQLQWPIEDLLVNLTGARGQTYLELSLQLRYRCGEGVENQETIFEENDAKVRDRLNILLSSKTVADLEGAENKQALKQEIRRALDEAIFPEQMGRVEEVYFAKFAVQ